MTTELSTCFNQPAARIAIVTEAEERTLASIRALYNLEDEERRDRAWAALGRKERTVLRLSMMLSAVFDEEVVYKLLADLADCHEAGCDNPTIIVCKEAEGDAA